VLPPLTALAAVRDTVPPGSPVLLGAQNAHWAQDGAYTGEVSMRMVRDAGASLVEIGHSERRELFGETDAVVARKVRAAVDHGLIPLLCVGEPAAVRSSGGAEEFVVGQLRAALAGLRPDEVPGTLVAYEPVWAIGAQGRPATPAEVDPVMEALRAELDGPCRPEGAPAGPALLYGGSVDLDNAAGLLAGPHTDGLFVGRTAWQVEGLLGLVEIGARHVGRSAS
jgi:triosephosphate isomerase